MHQIQHKLYYHAPFHPITDNWALLYAQQLALKMELQLHICFCLLPTFLDATLRQFAFMLKGLAQVEQVS